MIDVRLPWPPTVNNYYTVARGRKILTNRGRRYKRDGVFRLVEQRVKRHIEGRLVVSIEAHPPDKRKRDLDNVVKPIFDTLQDYGVFDDSQIDDFRVVRRGIATPGYVRVFVSEL